MVKVTKEMIEGMKKLREKGKTFREIGKVYGLAKSSVQYHTIKEYKSERIKEIVQKFKELPIEKRRKIYQGRREYQRDYRRRRYNEDEAFREKLKERARLWSKSRRSVI